MKPLPTGTRLCFRWILGSTAGLIFGLVGCGAPPPAVTATLAPLPAMQTAAIKTVVVMVKNLTARAQKTPRPLATTPSPSMPLAIETLITNTPSPETPTETPVIAQVATVNLQDESCNSAEFVADVTIPDDTILTPGYRFTKTWRILNTGTCPWTPEYKIIFVSGDLMGAASPVSLPADVPAGESIDVSVAQVAPAEIGEYGGNWMLQSPGGTVFGSGYGPDSPFWVKISVSADGSTGTETPPNVPVQSTESPCLPALNTGLEYELIRSINRERANQHLDIFFSQRILAEAARSHSTARLCQDSAADTPLANRLDALPFRRSRAVEYEYTGVDTGNFVAEVIKFWMSDPAIQKDLLDPGLTQIGVGFSAVDSAGVGRTITIILAAP